jgi:hypothetical protein
MFVFDREPDRHDNVQLYQQQYIHMRAQKINIQHHEKEGEFIGRVVNGAALDNGQVLEATIVVDQFSRHIT